VIEVDMESLEVVIVFLPNAGDQLLRRDAFLFSAQHDGVPWVSSAQTYGSCYRASLETHPDVGLDVFHQMAEVDTAIGIGRRT